MKRSTKQLMRGLKHSRRYTSRTETALWHKKVRRLGDKKAYREGLKRTGRVWDGK